jgi:hypothetical protein
MVSMPSAQFPILVMVLTTANPANKAATLHLGLSTPLSISKKRDGQRTVHQILQFVIKRQQQVHKDTAGGDQPLPLLLPHVLPVP